MQGAHQRPNNSDQAIRCQEISSTYKAIGTKTIQLLDQVGQILQISEGLVTVLLGCLIEEDASNGQVRVGRLSRPSGVCLDVLAH